MTAIPFTLGKLFMHTCASFTSSTFCYWPKASDALQLGR